MPVAAAPAPSAEVTPAGGWRGPILPVNTESGDGRVYLLDDAATLDVRPLPLPLCAQDEIAEGHDGGRVVGRIDRVWVEGNAVWGEGTFDLADPNAGEWARRLSEGYAGWISADMDRTQYTQIARDDAGNEIDPQALATGEVAEGMPLLRVSQWRLMGATLVSGPAFAEAKIAPADVSGPIEPVTAALTAAGIVYKAADFADPKLSGPTALTVDEAGHVVGHLALFDSCHIGFANECVSPPHSASSYRYFHQGIVSTDRGDLPVGKLTLGTGHASLGQDAATAAAHYDNSGTAVCVVRAGEDEHGIWLAGRILPGTGDARLDEMRRCGVSGDWRSINGSLELVAALCVNVPGFPVPRTEALAASGAMALVAAGVVANSTSGRTRQPCRPTVISRARENTLAALDKRMRAAQLDMLDRRMRAARLADLDRRMAYRPPHRPRLVASASGDHSSDGMIALLPTAGDAARLAVAGGEPADEMHLTIAYFPDAAEMGDDPAGLAALVAEQIGGPVSGDVDGHALFHPGGDNPCAVYLVQAPGLSAANQAFAPAGDYDSYTPHITAAYNPTAPLVETGPVTFDRVRVSYRGSYTDVALGDDMEGG